MWCPHTKNEITAMAMELMAMKRYPKMCRWEKAATSSLMTPMAGRIMMYTAG